MAAKEFHISALLSVTSGILLSDLDSLYEILSFMTGTSLYTHQLPRASRVCEPALFRQHPDLADVFPPRKGEKEASDAYLVRLGMWLGATVAEKGTVRLVEPLAEGEYEAKDPLQEMAEMRAGLR